MKLFDKHMFLGNTTTRLGHKLEKTLQLEGVQRINNGFSTNYQYRGQIFQTYESLIKNMDHCSKIKVEVIENYIRNLKSLFHDSDLKLPQPNPLFKKLKSIEEMIEEEINKFQKTKKLPKYLSFITKKETTENSTNIFNLRNQNNDDITNLRNQFNKKKNNIAIYHPNTRRIRYLINKHVLSEYEKTDKGVSLDEFTYHYIMGLDDINEQFKYVLSFD